MNDEFSPLTEEELAAQAASGAAEKKRDPRPFVRSSPDAPPPPKTTLRGWRWVAGYMYRDANGAPSLYRERLERQSRTGKRKPEKDLHAALVAARRNRSCVGAGRLSRWRTHAAAEFAGHPRLSGQARRHGRGREGSGSGRQSSSGTPRSSPPTPTAARHGARRILDRLPAGRFCYGRTTTTLARHG